MLKILLLDWSRAQITAKHVRQAVFINEQNVPEEDEWGHGDEEALHIVASLDGNPVATARLSADGTIGRMAVLRSFRHQGIGSAIMEQLIKTAKQNRFRILKLNAQRTAEGFYIKHGFVAYGEEFMDAGIPHIAMQRDLWSS